MGLGAGFYLNATDQKYRKHYNMYDLVVKELPTVLKEADLGLVSS
jgi:S-formylglutathione hydrolase